MLYSKPFARQFITPSKHFSTDSQQKSSLSGHYEENSSEIEGFETAVCTIFIILNGELLCLLIFIYICCIGCCLFMDFSNQNTCRSEEGMYAPRHVCFNLIQAYYVKNLFIIFNFYHLSVMVRDFHQGHCKFILLLSSTEFYYSQRRCVLCRRLDFISRPRNIFRAQTFGVCCHECKDQVKSDSF